MGFLSFITQDTNESIPNYYSSKKVKTVFLIDHQGNVWKENLYTGYGIFGGMDFFQLVAEMNDKKTREEGIEIYHTQDEKTAVFPNLVHSLNHWKWINKKPISCPHQGYFY